MDNIFETNIGYIFAVTTTYRHMLLLVLTSLFLALSLPAAAQPIEALNAPAASEFCGGAAPPKTIICPETRAAVCYCSMDSRSTTVEHQLQDTVVESTQEKSKPRKPRSYQLLPVSEYTFSLSRFEDTVPTPPPRS